MSPRMGPQHAKSGARASADGGAPTCGAPPPMLRRPRPFLDATCVFVSDDEATGAPANTLVHWRAGLRAVRRLPPAQQAPGRPKARHLGLGIRNPGSVTRDSESATRHLGPATPDPGLGTRVPGDSSPDP